MKRATVLLLCVLSLLLACKRKESGAGADGSTGSLGERAAKLQPEAKKRLTQLAALAPKVQAEPAVKKDTPVTAKPARGTFAVIGDKWLSDPNRSPSDGELRFGNTDLSLCKHKAEGQPKNDDDLKYLEQCIALKTIAVLRQQRMTPPKIKPGNKKFDSGEWAGDALVYDLESGKLLGSYYVFTTNDPELRLPGTDQTEQDWKRMAMTDLAQNAIGKVEKYLE